MKESQKAGCSEWDTHLEMKRGAWKCWAQMNEQLKDVVIRLARRLELQRVGNSKLVHQNVKPRASVTGLAPQSEQMRAPAI